MTGLSERDDLTLRVLAILQDTTIAEQRRRALAAYAQQARDDDPDVTEIVRHALATLRQRDHGAPNVIQLRSRT